MPSNKNQMTWEEALGEIRVNITKGLKLDKESNYGRPVVEVPPYACKDYDYANEEGYRVRIGSDTYIDIPVSMLRNCYEKAKEEGGVYKTAIIYTLYPQQVADHGGYVHVVGKIFEKAGVGKKVQGGYELA